MIGIPYKDKGRDKNGCDCYGIVYLFNKIYLNKKIPEYVDYDDSLNKISVDNVIEKHKCEWIKMSQNDTLIGDLVLFRVGSKNGHCGVMLNKTEFLHVSDSSKTSCIEKISSSAWKKRIKGFYRWQ